MIVKCCCQAKCNIKCKALSGDGGYWKSQVEFSLYFKDSFFTLLGSSRIIVTTSDHYNLQHETSTLAEKTFKMPGIVCEPTHTDETWTFINTKDSIVFKDLHNATNICTEPSRIRICITNSILLLVFNSIYLMHTSHWLCNRLRNCPEWQQEMNVA